MRSDRKIREESREEYLKTLQEVKNAVSKWEDAVRYGDSDARQAALEHACQWVWIAERWEPIMGCCEGTIPKASIMEHLGAIDVEGVVTH